MASVGFDPVSLALNGASLLGGILGKKRRHIDPEYLRQHFGAKAIGEDTTQIANYLLNSPYGQKLMSNAAESGQQFQTDLAARSAGAGLDGSSGASSGASDFATSAGAQAQNTFERGIKSDIYQQAAPIAAQQEAALQQAYLNDQQNGGYQDPNASVWQGIGNAAGFAASQITPKTTPTAPPGGTTGPSTNSIIANPQPQNSALGIVPAGTSKLTIPNGQYTGNTPFLSRLSARNRSLGMAMTGQNNVRPYQPAYTN